MKWIIAILMALILPGAGHAGSFEDCEQALDLDRRILGCTDRIRRFPKDAAAHFRRGAAYLSKGDLDRAIADSTTVIEIDPGHAVAHYNRGVAYAGKGDHEQAIADLSSAVEINPRYADAFNARARIYLRTNEHLLALRDAERAVALDPIDETFLSTRAQVYEALGHFQEAIADYRRLLGRDPSMQSAIEGLRRLKAPVAAAKPPVDTRGATPASTSAKGGVTRPRAYTAQVGYARQSQEELECEAAQQDDPSGTFAAYPCWARLAFSRVGRGRR